MSRATFEGPVLAGDNRFGNLRNVGYVRLVQTASMNLLNTTAATPLYGGSSGQFVVANDIPNNNGVVYTPSATTYPPVAATITADGANAIYRGYVAYLPANSTIQDVTIDCSVLPTVAAGNLTGVTVTVGNAFNANTYASTANISAVGRQALTYTAAQLQALQYTTQDITNPPANGQGDGPLASLVSQVVFTIAVAGNTMTTLASGQFTFTINYTQFDANIGNKTTYPYGNLG